MDTTLGISNYLLNSIDKSDYFFYISVLAITLFVTTQAKFDTPHLIGIVIGIVLILTFNDTKVFFKTDLNRTLELKLKLLDKKQPLFFHIDPDMINLFFSIKDFKKFNEKAFTKAMQTTDNVLRLKVDFEKLLKGNPVETFETAEMMAHRSLNYMQSFIISLPANFQGKFQTVLDRHHILLKRHLDFMFERSKELVTEINTSTKFITNYGGQKPYNPIISKPGHLQFDLY